MILRLLLLVIRIKVWLVVVIDLFCNWWCVVKLDVKVLWKWVMLMLGMVMRIVFVLGVFCGK